MKLAEKTKKVKNKKRLLFKRAAIIGASVAAIFLTATVSAYNYNKAAAYEKSASEAQSQCEDIKNDIKTKEDLIDGKGFDEYCEKIAREKYGYAKPGEYIIYDSSYGN